MSIVFIFLTKKSHKIHSTKESIKTYIIFNTKKQLISYEKSQLITDRFRCPKKIIFIVMRELYGPQMSTICDFANT